MNQEYERLTVLTFICCILMGGVVGWSIGSSHVVDTVPQQHQGVLPVAGLLPVVDMPQQALPGQREVPCASDQLAHVGACWARTDRKPPCKDYYELGGYCYVPVASPPPRRPMAAHQ